MTPEKTSAPRPDKLMKGFAAVACAAAVLAAAVLLVVSGGQNAPQPTEDTPPPASTPYISPIPANPFGPEDFVYEDGFLTCVAAPAALGVDVSSHQKEIDWEQVRSAGVEFAMIRIGYRGYTSGGLYEDEYARANLEGAKAAGLKVGAYFYSQATTLDEALEEALFCTDFLDGYPLDLPLVYDWEYVSSDARTGDMDRETLTACTKAFCDTVARKGYEPMIYFNPSQGETLLVLEELLEYPWWLAMYSSSMTYPHAVEVWQYTAAGSLPGITGDVDLNLWLGD